MENDMENWKCTVKGLCATRHEEDRYQIDNHISTIFHDITIVLFEQLAYLGIWLSVVSCTEKVFLGRIK